MVALHSLINNKIANPGAEKKDGQEKKRAKRIEKGDREKDKENINSDERREKGEKVKHVAFKIYKLT